MWASGPRRALGGVVVAAAVGGLTGGLTATREANLSVASVALLYLAVVVGAAATERRTQLVEVDRLRTAILAAVGHDLRTPLAAIKTAASSLRMPEVTFTAEERDELTATIEESVDRLADVVENLLASSRLRSGVLSAQPRAVALDGVVARAVLHAGPARRVRVGIADNLPRAYTDPGLLERVVANLVDNAVRHSPSVRITGRTPDDHHVALAVIDHGPGIPAALRDHIFTPFQKRGDTRLDGGLGLGLAIAKGLTEAMGGTLTPTDTPGGGLTMTVTLPAAAR